MLRIQFQQLRLLGQLKVLEAEGRTYGAANETEAALGGDLGGEPLLRLDDHLHLVLLGKSVDGQRPVRINDVYIERFARMEIPDFHHVVQTMERRYVVGGQHVIDGGDGLFTRLVVAEQLAVVASFRMRHQAQFLDVFCCVHVLENVADVLWYYKLSMIILAMSASVSGT